jgi:hypothetical protein
MVKRKRYDPNKPLFPQLTQVLKEKNKEAKRAVAAETKDA